MEKLSSDILEQDFIEVFRLIHWTQYLVGFHRVKIEHRYVTAPSVSYQFYSCFVWVLNVASAVYFAFNCDSNLEDVSNIFALKIGTFIKVIINAIVAYRNNFNNGNLNSQLYVKLQKIDRLFKTHGAATSNRKIFLLAALLTAVFIIIWVICSIIFNIIAMKVICPPLFFIQITSIAPYMEIVLLAYILLYLAVRLNYINVTLEKAAKKLRDAKMSLAATEYSQKKKQDHGELAVAIHGILDTWTDCIRLFQFPVLTFTCQLIIWDFTLMQCFVTAIKDKSANTNYIILNLVILLLSMTSIFAMSFLATSITSKTRLTRKICFNMLSMSSENLENGNKIQKDAQHILLLLGTTSNFSIYDIYTVDNRLSLHILAITATYTIVLLQFATL